MRRALTLALLCCTGLVPACVKHTVAVTTDAGTPNDAGTAPDAGTPVDGGIVYTPFFCADAGAGSAFDRSESFTAADGTTVQITICGPVANDTTVTVGPSDGGPAAAQFAAAIADAIDAGAGTLQLSPGVYEFGDGDAGSNWPINSPHDLIIDGQGATLLFHGLKEGIAISKAKRLLLKNLIVDWDMPLAISGTLQSGIATCSGQLAFIADANFPQDPSAPLPLFSMSQFDVATPGWPTTPFQQAHWAQSPAEAPVYAGDQTYCVGTPQLLSLLPSGTKAIGIARTNGANAIQITGSSDVALENVIVHAAPLEAIAFVNGGQGMRMSRVQVIRKPGDPQRLISTNADGVDFRQTLGSILLEDSEFADQADDGVSVVGMFFIVGAGSTPTQLFLSPATAASGVVAGDGLQIVDSASFANFGSSSVSMVTAIRDAGVTTGAEIDLAPPGLTALALDGGASAQLLDGGLLAQVPSRSSPNFLIRNVSLHDNDERGLLIHAPNGLVDRCTLANDLGMMLLAQDSSFDEGPGASNVIVQDTSFNSCGVMAANQTAWACAGGNTSAPPAPLSVFALTADSNFPFAAPNQQIVLQRNVINGAAGAGIFIASARDVTLSDNLLNNTNQAEPDAGCGRYAALPQGSIVETQSSQVALSGNQRDGGTSLGIAVDPSCMGCATQAGY